MTNDYLRKNPITTNSERLEKLGRRSYKKEVRIIPEIGGQEDFGKYFKTIEKTMTDV